MAFRKGKKKKPKIAITYFRPFHLFLTTASDYRGRTSPTAISSASSSGMFVALLFFISSSHLSSSSSSLPPSSHPTTPHPPPALPLFISPFLHLIRLRPSALFFFFFLSQSVWELGDLSHPPTPVLLLLFLSLIFFYLSPSLRVGRRGFILPD